MSIIRDTIEEIRQSEGVKGAAVVTLDGLVVAESLEACHRGDVLAGLASYLLMTTNKSLGEGGLGSCRQFVLHATHGKVVFDQLEDAYLCVIYDQFADLQSVRRDVEEAAHRIRRNSRLGE